MRTTPALRTLAAALLTGGTLAAAAAGTTAVAAPPTYADGHGGGGSPIWGTIVSRTDLNVRQSPTTQSPVVDSLSPGSQDRVQCVVRGQRVNGNANWYWLVGTRAWASAAFVDTNGRWVPSCSDPSPGWRDGDHSHDSNWNNDPDWNNNSSSWSTSASGSWSVSGSWSWSASGSSSGGGIWNWSPGGG